MKILKVHMNGSKRGGNKPGYPRRKPFDNQSENQYHIIIRGEKSPSQPGIEPSPANILKIDSLEEVRS